MNSIVLLCGGNSSGKSTTFLSFFDGCLVSKIRCMNFYKRIFHGKIVYGAGSDAPQELQQASTKTFCDVDWIKENVEKRIQLCDNDCKGASYILIIPWGMYENKSRTKLNEKCFLEPKRWLEEEKGFKVFPFYLRKKNATHKTQKNALAKKIGYLGEAETTGSKDCDKSKELEKFIITEILKS